MGKRSNFVRVPRDLYRTFDRRAVAPLISHLAVGTRFAEPCAGYGDLIDLLQLSGMVCVDAADIAPRRREKRPGHPAIRRADALGAGAVKLARGVDAIITNPPWRRDLLHPLITRFRAMRPTWLLFDADWMHTRQSAPFMPFCAAVVSVGRVRWIPGTDMDGFDNAAWYRFEAGPVQTCFYGRVS